MLELCGVLGYAVARDGDQWNVRHPDGRRLVFVGDLVDRGPDSPGVVDLVRSAVRSGVGFCVAGNHDVKLAKALRGRAVKVAHGLEHSLEQLHHADTATREEIAAFLDGLVGHYVMDEGRLVVAHAGETDAFELPVRSDWARACRGPAIVVYGHKPAAEAEWRNNTICLDTGCVFGGRLTALRYPERTLVSVPAHHQYYAPLRPLGTRAPAMTPHVAGDRPAGSGGRPSDRCGVPVQG